MSIGILYSMTMSHVRYLLEICGAYRGTGVRAKHMQAVLP